MTWLIISVLVIGVVVFGLAVAHDLASSGDKDEEDE